MNNRAPQELPETQLTKSKRRNLARELFNSDFWITGLARPRVLLGLNRDSINATKL